MASAFDGQLVISNTRTSAQQSFPVALQFAFAEQAQPAGIWAVTVAGVGPEQFPVSAAGMNDTITATPSAVTGAYDSQHGAMSLTLNVLFTDTGGHLPAGGELIMFALSTSGAITQQSAGMDAQGSALSAQGDITLVGAAKITVNVAIFQVGVTIGLKLIGTLAPRPAV